METEILEITNTKKETKKSDGKFLILGNDEYNTFEHVIECLVLYCEKTVDEAGEIAMIVHTQGACQIMKGSEKSLRPYYETLQENGLTVSIE